jgi:cytoskeleton protein RodZ
MASLSSPTDPSIAPAPDLPDIGTVLRVARQSRHATIADVAGATNVRASYIEALEEDGPLEAFPAPVYERFFLKEYARFLGLEEAPLVQALEARHGPLEPALDLPPPAVPPPKRWAASVLAAVAAAGLIFLAVTSLRPHHAARSTAGGPRPAAAAPSVAPSLQPSPTSTLRKGINAVLEFSAPCWVRASIDGKAPTARTHPAGSSVSFHGRRTLELVLGNAGGADLRINGKRFRTGSDGQVVTLYFVWRDGRVSSST